MNLFYIILYGYGFMYLITEEQGRYSYIVSWVFVILAIEGINFLLNKKNTKKFNENDKLENVV